MSTHKVEIIEIKEVKPHSNADKLEIIPIEGWQCVSGKGNFKVGDKAVYIQPDYVVPTTREEFEFLQKEGKDTHRLRAVRLRGELSYGLLIPVPEEFKEEPVGTNLIEELGIKRYEPPLQVKGADSLPHAEWPDIYAPKFDMENIQNFPDVIQDDDVVVATEKIHGANARYLYLNGTMYLGSRTRWLKPDDKHVWKVAFDNTPEIEKWCKANEGTILYGEVYGRVQSLKYGLPNSVAFVAFDASNQKGEWLGVSGVQESLYVLPEDCHIPIVPVLSRGLWCDMKNQTFIAEQDSILARLNGKEGQLSEGIVITVETIREREYSSRLIFKHISNRYWLGK